MRTFGSRLKKLREKRNLTQADFALIMNVSTSSIAMYEVDKREPPYRFLVAAADYFNVTTDYLLCRECTFTVNADEQLEKAYANLGRLRKEFQHDPDLLACYEPTALYLIQILESID